jgi:hypothetical protein
VGPPPLHTAAAEAPTPNKLAAAIHTGVRDTQKKERSDKRAARRAKTGAMDLEAFVASKKRKEQS